MTKGLIDWGLDVGDVADIVTCNSRSVCCVQMGYAGKYRPLSRLTVKLRRMNILHRHGDGLTTGGAAAGATAGFSPSTDCTAVSSFTGTGAGASIFVPSDEPFELRRRSVGALLAAILKARCYIERANGFTVGALTSIRTPTGTKAEAFSIPSRGQRLIRLIRDGFRPWFRDRGITARFSGKCFSLRLAHV